MQAKDLEALIFNRLAQPCSKLGMLEWLREKVEVEGQIEARA